MQFLLADKHEFFNTFVSREIYLKVILYNPLNGVASLILLCKVKYV